MKYITTDKHPELKEGVEITSNDEKVYYSVSGEYCVYKVNIEVYIKEGWIKKVEEKEFTKSDMIDFAIWYDNDMMSKMDGHYNILNEWLKQRQ